VKIIFGLILLTMTALAEGPSGTDEAKPLVIQNGEPAQSYIQTQLSEFLDKPAFLSVIAETPFVVVRVGSKEYWIAMVEFFFGPSEQQALHGLTVILFYPATSEHQFMTPADLARAVNDIEA
jgi:hypothetical protein